MAQGGRKPHMREEQIDDRILLGVLDNIEAKADVNQRTLASELGIALGLTNAYVKRCVRKGLIKVATAPSRRYRYYLTPKGFAEKARLTAEYMRLSLSFIRRSRQSYDTLFSRIIAAGHDRMVLIGNDDLTEVAALCALAAGLDVARLSSIDDDQAIEMLQRPGVAVLAMTSDTQRVYNRLRHALGPDRVMVPDILRPLIFASADRGSASP